MLAALLLVFTLLLADFFDTMGTMTAIGAEAGLLDEDGTPPNTQRILVVDSVAAVAGGAAGSRSNTSYIESASGVGEGARTGLASVVTGVLFLLATFFAPLVAMIPYEAAVPALVLVGFLMMQQVREHRLGRPRDRHPGVPDHRADAVHLLDLGRHRRGLRDVRAASRSCAARPREVHPLMWVVAAPLRHLLRHQPDHRLALPEPPGAGDRRCALNRQRVP